MLKSDRAFKKESTVNPDQFYARLNKTLNFS